MTEDQATAPRVTPADIDAAIVMRHFFTAEEAVRHTEPDDYRYHASAPELKRLTFCVLVLKNGFIVTGESCATSLANFNAQLGCKIAEDNARAKIWPLLGYALKDRLSNGGRQ